MKRSIFSLFLVFSVFVIRAQCPDNFIEADNDAIQYSGRFDFSNPKAVRFDWPGVQIKCAFTGKKIGVKIKGGERNYYNVFVDGELLSVLHSKGDTLAWISTKLKRGKHTFTLQKRTEAGMGTGVFYGIALNTKGTLTDLSQPSERRICFFGNSITCGYGSEGKSKKERFSPATENFNKSYAAVLSRAFGADYHAISHSGLGIVRNYGDSCKVSTRILPLPARIFRVLDNEPTPLWNMKSWIPHAVVINLGTNDFSTKPHPDKEVFQKEYVSMIGQIREEFGNVPVFCLVGPMTDQPCHSYVKEVVSMCRVKFDTDRIYFIGMPLQLLNGSDDLGSDYHPSWKGHLKIAAHIAPIISNVMAWDYNLYEMMEIRK